HKGQDLGERAGSYSFNHLSSDGPVPGVRNSRLDGLQLLRTLGHIRKLERELAALQVHLRCPHAVDRQRSLLDCLLAVSAGHAFNNKLCHSILLFWMIFLESASPAPRAQRPVCPKAPKQERVCHNRNRTECHCRPGNYGTEQPKRRKRNANNIVEKRPEQVLFYLAQGTARQRNDSRNFAQVATQECYVSRLYCNIGAACHCNSQVSPHERRRVVYAVSDHGNLPAARGERGNPCCLFFGQDAGEHSPDAC